MQYRWFPSCLLLLSVCLLTAGCGGSGEGSVPRTPVHPVAGKISVGGEPLADALVNFVGTSGQPTATGTTNAAGIYKLTTYETDDGAAEGEYTVVVTKTSAGTAAVSKELEPGDPGYGEPAPYVEDQAEVKYEVPEKYTRSKESPLKATVSAGAAAGAYDFDLQAE